MENEFLIGAINRMAELLQETAQLQREILCEMRNLSRTDANAKLPIVQLEELTRQQVKDYLGICEATYKRRVKDGSLKPMKTPGGHRYFKHELQAAYRKSINKGRI